MTKKEVMLWIKNGTKTIDVRKGNPRRGETAVFLSGPNILRLKIVNKETGKLADIAPTILKFMNIPVPENMLGNNLLETIQQT